MSLLWPVARLAGIVRCARYVREFGRFVVGESIRERGRVGRYHLRSSGVVVHLRHRTPDFVSFDQGFRRREFEPPAEVRSALAALGRPIEVVDLGANVGFFGAHVLGTLRPRRIVAFEPDPANSSVLRDTIAANRDRVDWELVEACAATTDGEIAFVVGGFGQSRTASDGDVGRTVKVPAVDVFPHLSTADLAKFDIEGSEWEILADQRFRELSATALHFEHHARLAPERDAQVFVVRELEAAGYRVRPMFESSPGNGVLWAWRAPP